jgi:tetratricopeptide (TPR) repeat protein
MESGPTRRYAVIPDRGGTALEQAVGVVQFRPAADFDRLLAVMQENPREVIPQGKHFLNHARLDPLTQARTYNLLCYTAACVLKRSEVEAVFHGHEAARIARGIPGREGKRVLFDSLINLGSAAERIGEYDRAVEAYEEALHMPMEWLETSAHEEALLTYLGRALYYRGDYKEALAAFDQASSRAAQRQDSYANEYLHSQRGRCHMKVADFETAEHYLELAAAITNEETRYELRPKGRILAGMAILRTRQELWDEAESYAQAALDIGDSVEDPHARVEAHMCLAMCAKARKRVQQVVEHAGLASRIAFDYGYVPLIQEMTWLMGYLFPQQELYF